MQLQPLLALATLVSLATAPAAHDPADVAPEDFTPIGTFYHVPQQGGGGELYSDQFFAGPFKQAVGLTFDAAGRLFVWERDGRVFFVDAGGNPAPEPLIDISEEVGSWSNLGLLGFALDPGFGQNGFLYLFYVVDHHHLENFGLPTYDPEATELEDTIARISRYQVYDPGVGGAALRADPASRFVLVGETGETGFPVCANTHAVGTLLFGEDGMLLASFGDSYSGNTGSGTCLPNGYIGAKEDVDNYRAQLTDSLAGKVVRVDPMTGDGLPDNPYYDPAEPRAPRSRVWVEGLRQPFRMTVRPGSGGAFHPGTLYIGDVGAQDWEELDVAPDGGLNFGWPVFEGMDVDDFYGGDPWTNLDAPNPLFGLPVPGGTCDQEHFQFQDLLAQEADGIVSPDLPNPCDPAVQVPEAFKRMHTRPTLAWAHDVETTLVKKFSPEGAATTEILGAPGASVLGDSFRGNASVGGVWYTGSDFPPQYQNTYFQADYGEGWIKAIAFNQNDRPVEVLSFTDVAESPVALATHPIQGGLYYIRYIGPTGSTVRKVTFVGNLPPVAVATPKVAWGAEPLLVEFSAEGSYDPEDGNLRFTWDFDDGSPLVSSKNVSHTFVTPNGNPFSWHPRLKVEDDLDQFVTVDFLVSVDNSPPTAEIVTPANGTPYSSRGLDHVDLLGSVSDAESLPGNVVCTWEVVLYHDNHIHPEPPHEGCVSEVLMGPHTNPGDVEYFEVRLTATDGHGLSTTVSHWMPREDDLNLNGYPDAEDIAMGISVDVDRNGVPDEADADCDGDGLSDYFTLFLGLDTDCDADGTPDACEADLDGDGTPDDCQPFQVDTDSISVATGGTQGMTVSVGPEHAGGLYWILGSLTGTSPGTPFGPVVLPLVWDVYFTATLTAFNSPPLVDTVGFLDAAGVGHAALDLPPGFPPSLGGLTAHHAAIVLSAAPQGLADIELVTNTMPLFLLP